MYKVETQDSTLKCKTKLTVCRRTIMKPVPDALRTLFSFGKEMDVLFFTTTKINVPASKTILPIRVNTAAGQGSRYLLCFQIDHCSGSSG